jgi:hypothetical protein
VACLALASSSAKRTSLCVRRPAAPRASRRRRVNAHGNWRSARVVRAWSTTCASVRCRAVPRACRSAPPMPDAPPLIGRAASLARGARNPQCISALRPSKDTNRFESAIAPTGDRSVVERRTVAARGHALRSTCRAPRGPSLGERGIPIWDCGRRLVADAGGGYRHHAVWTRSRTDGGPSSSSDGRATLGFREGVDRADRANPVGIASARRSSPRRVARGASEGTRRGHFPALGPAGIVKRSSEPAARLREP